MVDQEEGIAVLGCAALTRVMTFMVMPLILMLVVLFLRISFLRLSPILAAYSSHTIARASLIASTEFNLPASASICWVSVCGSVAAGASVVAAVVVAVTASSPQAVQSREARIRRRENAFFMVIFLENFFVKKFSKPFKKLYKA